MLIQRDEAPEARGSGGAWWWISRGTDGRKEAMTVPCEGREALALFGHEDDAVLFLRSLGDGMAGAGWRAGESGRGEVASVLLGSRAAAVALDPPPGAATDGTAALVSVDRRVFLRDLLPRDGARGERR